nr:DNA methyltransferase [Candidatus Sigynarchaeota archaeon]
MGEKKDKVELVWPMKKKGKPPGDEQGGAAVVEWERYRGEHEQAREPGNLLFWGDNIDVMGHLLATGYGGKVNLIYIDPPFFSGGKFSVRAPGGKFSSAYKDTWSEGLAQYLDYMHGRLKLMHELLCDGGTMYVHLDWHVSHYVKILLDEIFGYEQFCNQIIWKRLTYKQTQVKAYGVLHDVILYYTKAGKDFTW